jgi:hypothetical protein
MPVCLAGSPLPLLFLIWLAAVGPGGKDLTNASLACAASKMSSFVFTCVQQESACHLQIWGSNLGFPFHLGLRCKPCHITHTPDCRWGMRIRKRSARHECSLLRPVAGERQTLHADEVTDECAEAGIPNDPPYCKSLLLLKNGSMRATRVSHINGKR